MNYSIAIDGPAGAGKSTIAKKLAQQLNFIYVDTGAMYRAIAYYLFKHNICPTDEQSVEKACEKINIAIKYKEKVQQVYLNGEDITPFLREEEVGKIASISAKYKSVRMKLVELQRTLARINCVVMDGRDIGTYVLPKANLKIYLTASSKERAKRRWNELTEQQIACNIDKIEADIINRDTQDMNREISPLCQAKDAILIDSSYMTITEVVNNILDLYKEKELGIESK